MTTLTGLSQLDVLEAESIHVMREVAAEFERPALLFSGGKDSIVMLHLAQKAFWPARIPFPLVHVDTGHNFDEVLAFRDRRAEALSARLVVAKVQDDIDAGRVREVPAAAGRHHRGEEQHGHDAEEREDGDHGRDAPTTYRAHLGGDP